MVPTGAHLRLSLKPCHQDVGLEKFGVAGREAILRPLAFFNMKAGTHYPVAGVGRAWCPVHNHGADRGGATALARPLPSGEGDRQKGNGSLC